MTSKQRAKLRAMAAKIEPILYIGKEGITDHTLAEAEDALVARELVKGACSAAAHILPRKHCIF